MSGLTKVTSGQPLSIPAADYNAMIDAAIAHRGRSAPTATTAPDKHRRPGTISIENKTSAALEIGEICAIGDPIFDPAGDSFFSAIAFECIDVTDEDCGRWCVVLEPIPVDKIGAAVADGVALARVVIQDEEHLAADINPEPGSGEGPILSSCAAGSAAILWREDVASVPEEVWALVRIGPAHVAPDVWEATTDEDEESIDAKRITSDGTVFGEAVEFVVLPDYVEGS